MWARIDNKENKCIEIRLVSNQAELMGSDIDHLHLNRSEISEIVENEEVTIHRFLIIMKNGNAYAISVYLEKETDDCEYINAIGTIREQLELHYC